MEHMRANGDGRNALVLLDGRAWYQQIPPSGRMYLWCSTHERQPFQRIDGIGSNLHLTSLVVIFAVIRQRKTPHTWKYVARNGLKTEHGREARRGKRPHCWKAISSLCPCLVQCLYTR